MATKKDYLRATILSGAVSAIRADDSSPIEVSINPDNWGREQTLVSPVDGYFSLALDDSEADKQYMGIKLNSSGIELSTSANNSQQSLACFIPVKKGAQVKVSTRGSHKTWWAHFIKVIGGYKRYLKALACNRSGGSLWLRLKTTSETLRKEARTLASWRTSQPASATRPLLGSGQIQSLRPTTVSLQSLGKMLGWFSYLHSTLESKVYRQLEYALHTYLLKKGQGLTTSFNLRGKFPFVDSYQFSVASNNARMEVAA